MELRLHLSSDEDDNEKDNNDGDDEDDDDAEGIYVRQKKNTCVSANPTDPNFLCLP